MDPIKCCISWCDVKVAPSYRVCEEHKVIYNECFGGDGYSVGPDPVEGSWYFFLQEMNHDPSAPRSENKWNA